MDILCKHCIFQAFIFVLFILNSLEEQQIHCDTGHFQDIMFPIKFTVNNLPVTSAGCIRGTVAEETTSWPGPPANYSVLITSRSNRTFMLSWKTPDDSSANQLTGFLLEILIEDFTDTFSYLPSACFLVQFSRPESSQITTSAQNYALQDVTVHVNCKVTQDGPLKVRAIVKSLPIPKFTSRNSRMHKEVFVYADFTDTEIGNNLPIYSNRQRSGAFEPETIYSNRQRSGAFEPETKTDYQIQEDVILDRTTLYILLTVFFISLLILCVPVLIIIVLKLRSSRRPASSPNSRELPLIVNN